MNSRFSLGKIVAAFDYDFDGQIITIIKYNPRIADEVSHRLLKEVNENEFLYSLEMYSESFPTLEHAIIGYFAYKNLGRNQSGLVYGLAKALQP